MDRDIRVFISSVERDCYNSLFKQFEDFYTIHRADLLDIKKPSDFELDSTYIRDFYTKSYNTVAKYFASKTYQEFTGDTLPYQKSLSPLDAIIRFYIQSELGSRITRLDNTSKQIISALIVKAKEEGSGELKTAEKIQRDFKTFTQRRAQNIARTETIGMSNYGSLQGAKLTNQDLKKKWIASVGGKNDRLDHTAYDGTVVDLNDFFQVGGDRMQYPGDQINGSAKNVVNCACTIGYTR